jgi:hypothetical protein
MASHTAKEEVRKRDSRLETFLKRELSFDAYERIRSHEPCIVCSEKETRSFKFVAFDDYWIYLTENPPKKLDRVIHLRDVVSVCMVRICIVYGFILLTEVMSPLRILKWHRQLWDTVAHVSIRLAALNFVSR